MSDKTWYCSARPIHVGKFKEVSPIETLANIAVGVVKRKWSYNINNGIEFTWEDVEREVQPEELLSRCFDDQSKIEAAKKALMTIMLYKTKFLAGLEIPEEELESLADFMGTDKLREKKTKDRAVSIFNSLLEEDE